MSEGRQAACVVVFLFFVGAGISYVIGGDAGGWSVAIYALIIGAFALFSAVDKES